MNKEEWTEEVKDHCERCCDDKEEPSEVQDESIDEQKKRADSRKACKEKGWRAPWTVY